MKARDLMSQSAVTCRRSDSLSVAAERMWEHDCGALPVVGDDGNIVGMITDRDICMGAYTQGQPLCSISVGSAMAKQVFSCRVDDSLEKVERLMREKQIRRVPVLDGDNRPIGMISFGDIARYALTLTKKHELDHEVTQAFAAITQPRSKREASVDQRAALA